MTPALAVPVRRGRLAALLLGTGAALVLFSLVWQGAKGRGWEPVSLLLDRALDADHDRSVLNWLSTSVYLAASLAALLVALRTRRRGLGGRSGWLLLAAALLVFSLDEGVGLHDPVKGRLQAALDGGGAIVPVVLAVAAAAALVAVRFLHEQPPDVRRRLALAAVLLPVAAVGVDSIGPDLVDDVHARLQLDYLLRASAEEMLELVVAVLALDAALAAALHRGSGRDDALSVQRGDDREQHDAAAGRQRQRPA